MLKKIKEAYLIAKKGYLPELESRIKKKKERSWSFRLLSNWSNRLTSWENLLSYIKRFDSLLGKEGLGAACRDMMEILKIKISVKGSEKKMLAKDGRGLLLVGVNHESMIEPFVIGAVLNRNKVSLISIKSYKILGMNWSKLILPVMPRKYALEHPLRKAKLGDICRFHWWFYRAEKMSYKDIEEMHKNTFKEAARRLEKGETVIIFPGGGSKIGARWGRGMSEILEKVEKGKREKIDILPFMVKGLNRKKVNKIIGDAGRGRKLETTLVEVGLGKAIAIKQMDRVTEQKFSTSQMSHYLNTIFVSEMIIKYLT